MTIDVPGLLKARGQQVERYIAAAMSQWHGAPPRLLESIDYSLSAGGKRLRPALILEMFDALTPGDADAGRESALSSAAAMELV
ncbi:MAG: polyprenyl synthetase family protein, partial [Burkholderiales bacterium]|nr:polyprenyl synthetase family protein [Phycisphaerae bacterium]